MLTQLRDKLRKILDERAALDEERTGIVEAAELEERTDLTTEETARFAEIRSEIEALDAERGPLDERIAELEQIEEDRKAADEQRARLGTGDGPERRRVEVGNEERTYRPESEFSFFADAVAARGGHDYGADDRLRRHSAEEVEVRDVGTAAMGGLVVPQYLVDEFAPVLRDGRAFLNAVRREPLPANGMSLVIPRGETGVSVAAQASEGTAASETDVDYDDDLTVPVRTFTGQQDVSYQAMERGSGADRLIYADLVGAYAEAQDTSALTDDGTSGTFLSLLSMTGENVITYTDASPTVAEAFPKLADAHQQIVAGRKASGGLAWFMAPRRWGWFLASLDTTNRPLVVPDPGAAQNAIGRNRADEFGEGQLVGTLLGLPVIVDGNISLVQGAGTNEDTMFLVRTSDVILWEEGDGMPRELRFDDADSTGSLETKLLVYGYSAFTAERYPKGVSRISGTGLVAPTF